MSRKRKFPRYVKLELERLENREAPSVTPWITDTFDGITVAPSGSPPNIPTDWSQWSSDGSTTFAVTTPSSPITAFSGSNTFSVTSGPNEAGVSRAWLDQTMPADVEVSAAVYVNSLIPAQVIARGSNLDTPDDNSPNPTPSFYAAQLSLDDPGPLLSIVKDVNGTETTLASINAPTYVQDTWLVETLDVEGPTIRAQLFNPNTGEYLADGSDGPTWQTSQAWALDVVDNSITGSGFVGLGRPSGYTGTVNFDNFSVQTPTTDQTFDATTVGANSLPDNWSSYKSNTNDAVVVADPTDPAPPSGTNALAITAAESGDVDQAWLDTSLSANLSVSVDTYLDTLTPDQVFARGSELGTSSSSYYALEVTRGYLTASLVKVVDGTQTVLDTDSVTDSQYYVPDVWVQETLQLNGDTLSAIVYRTDTDQYLTSNGEWQSAWTTAMTVTDSSITGGGEAGVGRPVGGPLYQETQYYDDFTTAPGMDTQSFAMTPPSPPRRLACPPAPAGRRRARSPGPITSPWVPARTPPPPYW
ncbi:MAG TPA: hypothetical protein VMG10_06685 [Gemmataceae bacterium]|nr:hypothetical protein [Gemmataceae bacterium]